MSNLDKLKAISNSSGYNYIMLHSGDIFLIFSKRIVVNSDFEILNHHEQDQYTVVFECIYDREMFEKSANDGLFTKSIKLKDIQGMKQFGSFKF